ncbi:hypothetical protein CP980_23410 [Streptomyces vinaceus]|uniref:Uncharacterized protein n=1 Tax=Streptomyces vinaceus TaxID=1960 RepID=A0A5J6JG90_STRVI|nr:hypothetical protein CP980_23410 [Streptomyces vinaceus]GHE53215.1 hypothetical protein GCM10017778_41720 [Streptomyces vinaceus]
MRRSSRTWSAAVTPRPGARVQGLVGYVLGAALPHGLQVLVTVGDVEDDDAQGRGLDLGAAHGVGGGAREPAAGRGSGPEGSGLARGLGPAWLTPDAPLPHSTTVSAGRREPPGGHPYV